MVQNKAALTDTGRKNCYEGHRSKDEAKRKGFNIVLGEKERRGRVSSARDVCFRGQRQAGSGEDL